MTSIRSALFAKRATVAACSVLFAALALLAAVPHAAGARPPTYQARYAVEYKGRGAGESAHIVTYDEAEGRYRFVSRTTAHGIARLLRPRPIVEQSDFVLRDGGPRPLEFSYEDGTRKGEDDFRVEFDWEARKAEVTTTNGMREIELAPGALDRGTLQIALMLDLANGGDVGPYGLVDDDGLQTYRYAIEGTETVAAPAGTYEAVKVSQRREGSSRETIVWAAPALQYVPVKIEQRRDGETLTSLVLEAVEGL
ncbi:MAG TPA: DUF3108 domain-containing protein [Gammaproteobacteria bacterium]